RPQVPRHIVGEAMERHVPMDREADRRDLLAADPNASLGSLAGRVDAEIRAGAEEDLFDVRHEPFHLESVGELQDRIADELTGSVIRRLPAPFDLEDLQPRIQDVLALPPSAAGRDPLVLDEDDAIRAARLLPS